MATLRATIENDPTAPRRVNRDVPQDLDTICLKCLEKSPSGRYPTAQALADELGRYLQGEPIQARPASAVRKGVSWGRRHPGTLAAGVAAVIVALAFGVFYLFEENAYLRAQHADPTLTRVPAGLHDSLELWNTINSFAVVAGMYVFIAISGRARGLKFKDWLDPTRHVRPMQPLGERMRTFAACASLVMLGCGVTLLLKIIQAHVWEGAPIFSTAFQVYASTYFGLATLGFLLRDYRLAQYGVPNRQLTAEQIEPIRRAMEDFDVPAAIKSYRAAVPEAGLTEAREYVVRLADSLRAQHPGKYVLPPLSIATINWSLMLIGGAIEVLLFALLWAVMPPAYPAAFLSQFAYTFLFGMALMAGLRVSGIGKRMLLMVPALAVVVLSESIVPRLADVPYRSTAAYVVGGIFGVVLMTCGFTRRRRG